MSPIAAERCVGGNDLTEPRLAQGGRLLAFASSTAGVASLVLHRFDGRADEVLASAPPLRPGRGLGGGSWTFTRDGGAVVYIGVDGNVWLQTIDGRPAERLTDHGPDRVATSPCVAADGDAIVYVLDLEEVHRVDVASGHTTRLDDGTADFCMDAFVDADGVSVRWLAWNVPDMPWDRSRVQRVGADGLVHDEVTSEGAVQQPRSLPDGTPVCVRDDSGWLNVWVGEQPLIEEPFEHAGPSWGPGQQSFVVSPDNRQVAFTRNDGGFGRLCVVNRADGHVREIARGVHGHLSWSGQRLAAVRSGARTPTQVVVYDTATWQRTVVAVGPQHEWQVGDLVEPERVELPVADGVLHARLYRTAAAGAAGVASERKLIVWLHGGPTDQWQVSFMPRLVFWLSRGWSILVPDHRGSTGHGRAYQQALRGRWGELDVADTLAVTCHAHAQGWALPERTVVFGSSAGGFTALGAVAIDPRRFAAAVLLYPVTDLTELAERSHRFERHYTSTLVGALPETLPLHRLRSPTFHADRFVHTPLLLMHGDDDVVVPVRQSAVFAHRVRAAGGDVQLHVYPGEGHGFRQVANQLDEYRRAEEFLARYVPLASRS